MDAAAAAASTGSGTATTDTALPTSTPSKASASSRSSAELETIVLAGKDPRDADPLDNIGEWNVSALTVETQQRWRIRFGSTSARDKFEAALVDAKETVLRGRRELSASVFRL